MSYSTCISTIPFRGPKPVLIVSLQIFIEGVRGSTFEGDIAVDSITFTPGRCVVRVSEEEIQADSHLALGENSALHTEVLPRLT